MHQVNWIKSPLFALPSGQVLQVSLYVGQEGIQHVQDPEEQGAV